MYVPHFGMTLKALLSTVCVCVCVCVCVFQLENEVASLKRRLDELRKAKNTTILKREREVLEVGAPFGRRWFFFARLKWCLQLTD